MSFLHHLFDRFLHTRHVTRHFARRLILDTLTLGRAIDAVVGESGHLPTTQSLGGEDFAWFLEHVPGAMARLGTRTPGGPTYDLHQGDLRVDEGAVPIAAKVLAAAAVHALTQTGGNPPENPA